MKKCYLSEVDKNYSFNEDLVLGPWCFKDIISASKAECMEAYEGEDLAALHQQLYTLGINLLIKDADLIDEEKRQIFLLKNQYEYLYFVFFGFYLFSLIKKTLSAYPVQSIAFEKVSKPAEMQSLSSYLDPTYFGYLAMQIIEVILKNEQTNWFTPESNAKEMVERDILQPAQKLLTRIKNKLNYFSDIRGIYFIQGLLLTIIYKVRNLQGKRKPNYFIDHPALKINTEILEFIEIFRELFSNYKIKEDSYVYNNKSKKLHISTPGKLIFSEKLSDVVYRDYLVGKTNLCIIQHGGMYGFLHNCFRHEIEYNFPFFISWGTETYSNIAGRNIINHLPSPHLNEIKDLYVFDNQEKISWIAGGIGRCGDGLEYMSASQGVVYYKKKLKLFNNLDHGLARKLIYKSFSLKHSSILFEDPLLNEIPKIQQISTEITAITLVLNSKFSIMDYMGTPFYEAMSMNAPVVLCLCQRQYSLFTDTAAKLLKEFEKLGVVHSDPQKAAVFINSLHEKNVEEWWQSEGIQDLRLRFIEMYANNKPYFWPWAKAILKREI